MKTTLCFEPGGGIVCLYTDAVDLRQFGRLKVVRATDIRFHHHTQQWVVHQAGTGAPLYSDSSREACVTWERENLGPATTSFVHQ